MKPLLLALLFVPLAASVAGDGDADIEVPEAKAALETLDAMIKARAFPSALAQARAVLDKRGDDPVATEDDVFLPASALVRRKLAALPEDGRAALEKLDSDEARKKLEAARPLPGAAALVAIGDAYFPLDEGALALLAGGDRLLERGNVASAVAAWRDVAVLHPSRARRAQALKRLEAGLPLLGSPSTLSAIASRLEGDDRKALEALLPACTREDEDRSVDASGNVAPVPSVAAPAPLAILETVHSALPAELDWRDHAHRRSAIPLLAAEHLGAGNALILHLGRGLVALDARTRNVLWRHEDRLLARYFASLLRSHLAARFGLASSEGRVFATLQTDSTQADTPRGRLVALDARTGKLLWDVLASEWDEDQDAKRDELDRETRFSYVGTPLPAGDRVFCGATDAAQPSETWLAAFDASSGNPLWRRRLALSSSLRPPAGRGAFDPGRFQRAPAPSLGVVAGALVVSSNNGAVFAVDPADGRLLWARGYESKPENGEEMDAGRASSPPLAVSGAAAVLPTDSANLLFLDPTDGRIVRSEPRSWARRVLGVRRGRVLLAGHGAIAGVGLEGSWRADFVPGSLEVGRGLFARDVLYLPTTKGLDAFDPDTGERLRSLAWGEERAERAAGDLVAVSGRIASVGVLEAAFWGE